MLLDEMPVNKYVIIVSRLVVHWSKFGIAYTVGVFTILALIWFLCAVFFPVVINFPNWIEIQNIWNRWQPLNVGFIALTASVIGLWMARVQANRDRNDNFIAARAFLPEQFSALTNYLYEVVAYLNAAYGNINSDGVVDRSKAIGIDPPALPQEYREVFRDVIRFGDNAVRTRMTKILRDLQILDSRIMKFDRENSTDTGANSRQGGPLFEIHIGILNRWGNRYSLPLRER